MKLNVFGRVLVVKLLDKVFFLGQRGVTKNIGNKMKVARRYNSDTTTTVYTAVYAVLQACIVVCTLTWYVQYSMVRMMTCHASLNAGFHSKTWCA